MSEEAAAAARSLEFYLRKPGLTHAQRDLLMSDYAARRQDLTDAERAYLDEVAINAHLPEHRPTDETQAVREPASRQSIDFAIVTILPVELRAAKAVFQVDGNAFDLASDGTRYFTTSIRSQRLNRDLRGLLTVAEGAYDTNAAETVGGILRRWAPSALFLVGIAAGNIDKLKLGDVVVPRRIMNYEAERLEPDGAKPRPRYENVPREVAINLNHYDPVSTGLRKRVVSFCKDLATHDRPRGLNLRTFRPTVLNENCTIGVGAKLVADGRTMGELRARDDVLIAVDQESFGFARACRDYWWTVFRGISDFGDQDKKSDWHFVASAVAALTLLDFLEKEYIPPEARR